MLFFFELLITPDVLNDKMNGNYELFLNKSLNKKRQKGYK